MSRFANILRNLLPGARNARVLENFNLEQYGARSLDCYDLTKPHQMLDPTQVRAMALGLPLFFWSDLPVRLLAQLKPTPYDENKASLAE